VEQARLKVCAWVHNRMQESLNEDQTIGEDGETYPDGGVVQAVPTGKNPKTRLINKVLKTAHRE